MNNVYYNPETNELRVKFWSHFMDHYVLYPAVGFINIATGIDWTEAESKNWIEIGTL